jgi:hypothetical protein
MENGNTPEEGTPPTGDDDKKAPANTPVEAAPPKPGKGKKEKGSTSSASGKKAQTNTPESGTPSTGDDSKKQKKIVVEVVCEGVLGTQLLKKGDTTSDPEYVALIDDERELVKKVK